ncbi:histidine kinase [Pedobacter sp. LMG 31643]|nr:histidine kinase [Pedobacter foliorum]
MIVINKIRNWTISLSTLIVLLILSLSAYSQSTYLQHFGTKDGLPSNSCFYTLQDSKGYIWVATDAGVSRFDGKVFENFSVDDGLPDNQILQIKEDKSGKIWFLALNGQLSYFLNGKFYNETNNKLLKQLRFNAVIVSFFEDSKGKIWFGTNKNVLVTWDGKSIMKYISANGNRQFINSFVHEDRSGKIWIYSNRSVRTFDGSKFMVVPHKSLLLNYKSGLNLSDKTFAFLDQNGLNLQNGTAKHLQLKIDPALLNNDPGFFYLDENKDIWVSNASGIYFIDHSGKMTTYLSNISSSQVIKDSKGNMWFTTNNGIYMLPKSDERLYIINQSNGLSSDVIKSVIKDNRNHFWLGLDEADINILDPVNLSISKISLPDKKKYNVIKQLTLDTANQTIYFASEYGLGRIANIYGSNKKIDYLREATNSMFVIKSFSVAKDKSLSLALSSGVVILPYSVGKFEFSSLYFKEGTDFFNNRAYCVFFDKNQNLWFSNINGLSEFSNGSLYSYYERSSLLTRRINDIKELNDGTLVLATDGYGIIFIKNRKVIKVITQRDGLADNICKKLFVKDNDVWIITNNGINKVSLYNQKTLVETFEYTNALLKDDVNSLYIDNNYAYFATNSGLVYFTINKAQTINDPPKVLISSIINNKIKLGLNETNHTLDPSDNNISFYYSAIDFQNRNIVYRYRLKSNANWTETKNRRLEFSSLEPGDYVFEISAKTNNSDWSSPTRIRFILKSHFWQTPWFLALTFVLAGFVFYKVAVFVTKRRKNKEQEQLLLKNKILMLEQRALQAMMNPHFVFNVMNSIQHYINTKDTTSANKILTGFARLIRKNLEICTKSFISLEEEIEYLELYLSLEKKRFGGKLNYSITLNKAIDKEETLIPSMLLQPYIENAIWHGIMPKEEGGNIDIHISLVGTEYLLIQIIDDGIGIDNSLRDKKGHHVSKGMDLTRERINLLNRVEVNPIQMEIKQNGNSGTFVSISIPLKW